jgi:energy-coupling factor transport system permease protein
MLIAIVCAMVIGVDFSRLIKRLKRLWQALIIVSILRSVFTPYGTILLQIAQVPIVTSGGIQIGALVLLRLALFIICGAMFTCYPVRTLIQGMVQIKMPYEIAYMVSVGVRFIPQLAEELKDSLTALQLRGVVIDELKLKKRLSLYTYLMLPVIVSSLQNAKELAMSMEMRAFRAHRSRTSFFELSLRPRDIVMLSCILAFTVLMSVTIFMGVHLY